LRSFRKLARMYEGTCVNLNTLTLNTLILNTLTYELCKENLE
jgi:hypothetical protein